MLEAGNTFLTTVEKHYQQHLAAIYSWMSGDFNKLSLEQYEFYTQYGIQPFSTGIAVDLGAGHGIHTAALAKCGFTVIAVDFNSLLLEELRLNTLGWGVHTIQQICKRCKTLMLHRS
jgi:2-polyprenyl-3-methyl-5-hydroxy-6-metoxy-1,4-benzoquinol methylase